MEGKEDKENNFTISLKLTERGYSVVRVTQNVTLFITQNMESYWYTAAEQT